MDGHRPHDPGSTSTTLSQAWHEHHRYLLDLAYRMLGSVSDAEDVVQETFARLVSVDLDRIEDPRARLVVVVSRLCLDQLRSAPRSPRETYVGPWLPEPLIPQLGESGDPAERVTLDDSVRMALRVMLERLTPAERAAFVLHNVFQFSFDALSSIVGRSPAACRQLASRARRQGQAETGPARFTVEPAEQRRVAERFIAATSDGDLDELMQLLGPDVVEETDTSGITPGPPAADRRPRPHRQVAAPVSRGGPHNPHPDAGQRPAWRSCAPVRSGRGGLRPHRPRRPGQTRSRHHHPYKLAYVMSLLQPND
jgi:RNA polymerase sigma-70 factor (ECF subfamily)